MTEQIIKEIAEQLDSGSRAYVHKISYRLIFIPDETQFPGIDLHGWEKEIEELEKNMSDYHEVEKWTSSEGFEVMVEFSEQVNTPFLKSKLFNALDKGKPFRNFKAIIDDSGHFRQKWFTFKDKWQQEYVKQKLAALFMNEED